MIVDFQHHYTPPELMDNSKGSILTRLNANQDPILRLTPLLADLPAHVRMMDQAGIDAAVLSCLQGLDEPNVATCRLINNCIKQAERDHCFHRASTARPAWKHLPDALDKTVVLTLR